MKNKKAVSFCNSIAVDRIDAMETIFFLEFGEAYADNVWWIVLFHVRLPSFSMHRFWGDYKQNPSNCQNTKKKQIWILSEMHNNHFVYYNIFFIACEVYVLHKFQVQKMWILFDTRYDLHFMGIYFRQHRIKLVRCCFLTFFGCSKQNMQESGML